MPDRQLEGELEELRARLQDAEQAMHALTHGEVDAVVSEANATPLLLRAAQDRLRESERLWRAVFDGALDAMLLIDDSHVYLDANLAACELFGISRERLLQPDAFRSFVTEPSAPAAWDRLLRDGRVEGQFRLTRADGAVREIEVRATAGILPGRHLAVLRDVTEKHLAESRFRALIERSTDVIMLLNASGTISYTSPAIGVVLGYHPSELDGVSLPSLIHPLDTDSAAREYYQLLSEPAQTRTAQLRMRHHDGSYRWVEAVSRNQLNDPAIRALIVNFRDVTERREALETLRRTEMQLRQSQKMEAVGVLAGGVAHDFNNVLSVILSFTSMALDELEPGQPLRDDIEQIHRAGQRATGLTRQLLAFSRQQLLQPRVLHLGHVARGLEPMLRRLVGEHIELTIVTESELGRVHADPGQVEQVLMNLVVNARDAMPLGGKLSIETRDVELTTASTTERPGLDPGDYVAIITRDTGVGMHADVRERIFDPFFTTKEMGKGTGLGLSTVFGIVKQSGGHIEVLSEPDQGSTFTIYFPRTDRVPAPVAELATPTTLRGTETVLLVEDEAQVRAVVRSILQRSGYTVLDAQNGGEAFLVCESHPGKIDLLLTDVVMPRMSGRELVQRLSRMRPEMLVIYMSGYTEDNIVHHGVLDEGIAFLQKPITPHALMHKVRAVLDAGRAPL